MNSLAKLKQSELGQAVVEFALVLPLILILVLGSIDAGWFLYAKLSATAAAREGARDMSVMDETDYNDTAPSIASIISTPVPGAGVIMGVDPIKYTEGAEMTVTVITKVAPLAGFVFSDSVDIESKVTMQIE